jgi:opacity protein-like surface antigen
VTISSGLCLFLGISVLLDAKRHTSSRTTSTRADHAANLKTNFDATAPEGTASKELKLDWSGTVRGRIGYAFNNWLLYGTGGFAWARFSHYNIQITCGPANPTCIGAGLFNPETLTSNLTGWTAGGGLEVGLSPNWTAKLEYLHMDFGSFRQTGVIFDRRYDINSLTTDVVRLGLNYRFGGS